MAAPARPYLQHLAERYGFYQQAVPEKVIWVHAVSVGETRAAQPLIAGLQAKCRTIGFADGITTTGRRRTSGLRRPCH
jgi:3-deoxy-D-manno-octulosonic-acid transferase